jgi:hypothetical protein
MELRAWQCVLPLSGLQCISCGGDTCVRSNDDYEGRTEQTGWKSCSSITLSTTNVSHAGLNPRPCDEKPACRNLKCGTDHFSFYIDVKLGYCPQERHTEKVFRKQIKTKFAPARDTMEVTERWRELQNKKFVFIKYYMGVKSVIIRFSGHVARMA